MHMAVENQRYLPRDMVALVEENREKMRFYRRRLRDLLAAQLIPDRERQLRECFSSEVWQDFAMSPLIDNATGHHLGLIIAATRRPS